MTLTQKVVGILGMVQVLFVTYSVLVVNCFLAERAGEDTALVGAFRNYGVLLFLVPLTWTMLSSYYVGRPKPPFYATPVAFLSWVAVTALLLACDVFLTVHAVSRSAVLKV